MTRSVLVFAILPGRRAEFVKGMQRLEVLQRASYQPGFRGGQLHVRSDGSDEAIVIADWDSPEAYQGWLDNPIRTDIQTELGPLLAADPEPRVYEMVEGVAPPGGPA
jgi:antibiotic biosynthesis monooxygenase (ABM) superfamily enzyme